MKKSQLAVQLYTLRKYLNTPGSVDRAFARIREIGYEAVQVSGVGAPYAAVKKAADANGLTICASHPTSADLLNNRAAVIEREKTLGCTQTVSHSNNKLQNTILLQQIILSVLCQIPMEAFSPQKKHSLDSRIREILRYIEKNPGEHHTVESLSEKVKMSVNNFHRKFVAGTDTTPKQYLLKVRMGYARKLFMETRLTIDEVAAETGFSDRYHFSKIFKKYFLNTPAAFRKKFCGAGMNDQSAI